MIGSAVSGAIQMVEWKVSSRVGERNGAED